MLNGTQVAGRVVMPSASSWPSLAAYPAFACDFVRAEVVCLGEDGPYRLTVFHARGTIVEYFADTAAALKRQGELEHLLAAACGATLAPLGRPAQ